MTNLNSPEHTPAEGDPGDETARRYRFQWTYAAIACCMLLDDSQDVLEVFCEHHEDILLKHDDGTFSGLQIKSRATDQEVWKTSDLALRSAFARFVSLEGLFPGQFRKFSFLTNHPLHSAQNGQDIIHVLKTIQDASTLASVTGPARTFLKRIAALASYTENVAFVALKKARANHDLPKLSDIHIRLVSTLTTVWPRANECSHEGVVRAALSLVDECGRASSLAHMDILPAYIPVTTDPEDAELRSRISGKRIDQSRLLNVLDRGLDATAPLHGDPGELEQPGSGTTALLRQKLDAGGFSAVSLNSAEDLRNKADYLGLVWTKKHGHTSGLQRYTHIRSLVLRDSADAFEIAKSDDCRFGTEMLSELRQLLTQRRASGDQLYDCSIEHLEGFTYSLTSQCTIVWSLDRPWEAE